MESIESEARRSRRRRRRRLRRLLEVVLVGAALYLGIEWVSESGWIRLTDELRAARPTVVALLSALLLARWAIWTSRWRLGLRRRSPGTGWWHAALAILAAAAVNHLTPSFRVFGGLLRARYLGGPSKRGFAAAYGTVLFDQIVAQTVIGGLSGGAFVFLAWRLGRLDQMFAAALGVSALLLLVPLLLRRLRRRRLVGDGAGTKSDGVADRLGALWRRAQDVLRSLDVLLRDTPLLLGAIGLSLLYVVANWVAACLAFTALDQPVDPVAVFLALSLGTTVGALSGTPGGTLTTEASMVACYGLLGIDHSTALAATLLYRGLHYLLVATLGLPSLAACEALYRRRRSASAEP